MGKNRKRNKNVAKENASDDRKYESQSLPGNSKERENDAKTPEVMVTSKSSEPSDSDSAKEEDSVPMSSKQADFRDLMILQLNQLKRDNSINVLERLGYDQTQMETNKTRSRKKSSFSAENASETNLSRRKQSYLKTKFSKLRAQTQQITPDKSFPNKPTHENFENFTKTPSVSGSPSKLLSLNASKERTLERPCPSPNYSVISSVPVALIKQNKQTVLTTSKKVTELQMNTSIPSAEKAKEKELRHSMKTNKMEQTKTSKPLKSSAIKKEQINTSSSSAEKIKEDKEMLNKLNHAIKTIEMKQIAASIQSKFSAGEKISEGPFNFDIFEQGVPQFYPEIAYLIETWNLIKEQPPIFEDLWISFRDKRTDVPLKWPRVLLSTQNDTDKQKSSLETETKDEQDITSSEFKTDDQVLLNEAFSKMCSGVESIEVDKKSNPDLERDFSESEDVDAPEDFRAISSDEAEKSYSSDLTEAAQPSLNSSQLGEQLSKECEPNQPRDPECTKSKLRTTSDSSNNTFNTVPDDSEQCEAFPDLRLEDITMDTLREYAKKVLAQHAEAVSTSNSLDLKSETEDSTSEHETVKQILVIREFSRKLFNNDKRNKKNFNSLQCCAETILQTIYISHPAFYMPALERFVKETEYLLVQITTLRSICEDKFRNLVYPEYVTSTEQAQNEFERQALIVLKKDKLATVFNDLLFKYFTSIVQILHWKK